MLSHFSLVANRLMMVDGFLLVDPMDAAAETRPDSDVCDDDRVNFLDMPTTPILPSPRLACPGEQLVRIIFRRGEERFPSAKSLISGVCKTFQAAPQITCAFLFPEVCLDALFGSNDDDDNLEKDEATFGTRG